MKRSLLIFLFIVTIALRGIATEGMWLPMLLEKYNIEDMQQKGFRLTAEDIYSINQSSMKDAVVRIGGCTGSVISRRGLVITNHHCAYGAIQSHSSVENDYLTDGFWAMSDEGELPVPGLTVTFLVRMEDVTEKVSSEISDDMGDVERQSAIDIAIAGIRKEATEGTRYRADVNTFFYGSEYYLFVYDVFDDIRLTGAPPSSIGKFGGDTDNWMWPRHTGDFAFFRIYASPENRPAGYSEENVPYSSTAFLPVSTSGTREDDFTMVFGFPGTTSQYLTSQAVRLITELSNPHKISLRDERLDIMGSAMEQSDVVRIQYASKYAGISNAWKKWKGENLGLARIDAIGRKKETEDAFNAWVDETPGRKRRYGHLMPLFDSLYTELKTYTLPRDYGTEALYAIEIIRFARDFSLLAEVYSHDEAEPDISGLLSVLRNDTENFFKNYNQSIDREVFVSLLKMYRDNIDPAFYPAFFATIDKEFDSDFNSFAEFVFSESIFGEKHEVIRMLDLFNEDEAARISIDPVIVMLNDIRAVYNENVLSSYNDINDQITSLYKLYVEGLRSMKTGESFWPDANRTLRVAYGEVKGYQPRDGVFYDHYSTLSGVFEKYTTGEADYIVPGRLLELYHAKDFGPWAVDGEMRVAFTATNHTSGGNSGSAVINGDGQLIGVNFDRVWEGTMSDIMFDPERCRNISVDINYVLFITDRFAGAGYLLEEMSITNK